MYVIIAKVKKKFFFLAQKTSLEDLYLVAGGLGGEGYRWSYFPVYCLDGGGAMHRYDFHN